MTLKIAPHSHSPRFAKRRKMCRSSSADRRQHIRKGPKYQGVLEPQKRTLHTISSQSRYDHFDTAPYLSQHQHLGKRGELMGRTSKNIKLEKPENPSEIKGFRGRSYREATMISSQPRYDHFDTSPCCIFKALRVSARHRAERRNRRTKHRKTVDNQL